MFHRDEAFDYIEQQVRYAVLRDEGMNPIEATVKVLSELDPEYSRWRLRTLSYRFYVKFVSDLYEMDYARKRERAKRWQAR